MGVDREIRNTIARAFRPEPVYGALAPAQLAVNLIAAQLLTNVFVPVYMALSFYGRPTDAPAAKGSRPLGSRFTNATLYERWHEMRRAHLSFVTQTTALPAHGGARALAPPDDLVQRVALAFQPAMPAERRALALTQLAPSPPPARPALVVRSPAPPVDTLQPQPPQSYTTELRRLQMAAVFGKVPATEDIDELVRLHQLYMRTQYDTAQTDDQFALLWLLMVQLILLYKGVRLAGAWQKKVAGDLRMIERSWKMEPVPTARLPPRLSELVRSAEPASGAATTNAVVARAPAPLHDALRSNLELERAVRRYDVLVRYSCARCYQPPVHYDDVVADLYMGALEGTIQQVQDVRQRAKGVTIETVGRGAVVVDPNEVARAEHQRADRENSALERGMRNAAVVSATAAAEVARHERMQECAAVAAMARRHFDRVDRRSAHVADHEAELERANAAVRRAKMFLPVEEVRERRSKEAAALQLALTEAWKQIDEEARADQAARKQRVLAHRPAATEEYYDRTWQTYGDDNTSACEDCDYMPATMAALVTRYATATRATASKETTKVLHNSADLFRALYAVVRCVQHGMDLDEALECFSGDAASETVCKCAFEALSGDTAAHDVHGRLEYLSLEACEAYATCLPWRDAENDVRAVLRAVTPSAKTWLPKGHWLAKRMLLGNPPQSALATQCRDHKGTGKALKFFFAQSSINHILHALYRDGDPTKEEEVEKKAKCVQQAMLRSGDNVDTDALFRTLHGEGGQCVPKAA